MSFVVLPKKTFRHFFLTLHKNYSTIVCSHIVTSVTCDDAPDVVETISRECVDNVC